MLTLLIVLSVSFGILSLVDIAGHPIPVRRRGQISLGYLFIFTGISHFLLTKGMAKMVPPFIPAPELVIYLSGIIELVLARALIRGWKMPQTGWAVIAFLAVVFPSNIYAAMARVDFGGHAVGPSYLWIRTPFQLFLIAWTYYFCVRKNRVEAHGAPVLK
jgi:uncharacterized membrane protein